ncbi:hypothetical protein [Crocosphaera watsonii]|uniref:hypothetical protein n=1 Tax=Crocosphaera watsonii TaxID=263511 RepID=UPI000B2C9F15|nr:hypothetical protein [Crocosphaera watsonii]
MTQLESKKPASLPPGDKGLPLIGESLSFLFDPDFGKKKLKNMVTFIKPISLVITLLS